MVKAAARHQSLLAPNWWQVTHAGICTFEMVDRAPGRWTLTATCSPVERSLALYTCRAAPELSDIEAFASLKAAAVSSLEQLMCRDSSHTQTGPEGNMSSTQCVATAMLPRSARQAAPSNTLQCTL